MSGGRRFFVETWGCQMNELDSQRMSALLMEQGILPTRAVEDADVILLNSCSVRDKAEQKVYSRIGQYRKYKENRDDVVIGLCGCVACCYSGMMASSRQTRTSSRIRAEARITSSSPAGQAS